MTQVDSTKIAKMVTETLGNRFEDIKIVAVNVERDVDRDGYEILRIEIVFDGKLKKHDAREVASAARLLRPRLDPDIYPLLSFVSRIDYDRGHGKGAAH